MAKQDIKNFSLKIFPFATGVHDTGGRWCTLRCEDLFEFSNKFETALIVYSGAYEKLIHEKTLKLEISWHCPF